MLEISRREFNQLTAYIRENYGIHLKDEKRTLLIGRLRSELLENGFDNFSSYYDYLLSDRTGNAVVSLINKITTNHTYFMREANHFNFFKDKVLPLLNTSVIDKDLRIWSAGCSTGEEPYTLAMIMDEYFGRARVFWDTKVLATDISDKVLKEAIRGVYSSEKIASLPPEWRINYFKKHDDENHVIINRLRDEVIFRRFNLMEKQFPFRKKFHVIFCRNVMIYFDSQTKEELVNKFYNSMEYGGYLFVGHSESLDRKKTKFRYIIPAVYRKD